jgi:hypothetical protein
MTTKPADIPFKAAVALTGTEGLGARRAREHEHAEDNASLTKEKGLDDMGKAVLGTFEPHERRAKRAARQISFILTEEEHENLSGNARRAGVTTRALILRALKPFTEKVIR